MNNFASKEIPTHFDVPPKYLVTAVVTGCRILWPQLQTLLNVEGTALLIIILMLILLVLIVVLLVLIVIVPLMLIIVVPLVLVVLLALIIHNLVHDVIAQELVLVVMVWAQLQCRWPARGTGSAQGLALSFIIVTGDCWIAEDGGADEAQPCQV